MDHWLASHWGFHKGWLVTVQHNRWSLHGILLLAHTVRERLQTSPLPTSPEITSDP